ncbi:MAG: putative metal-binding motif-containing protein, partial [Myxococcota bacterium]|nr:putative metal-binding motif-containing protein [Myxococcota bacterium]
MWIPATGRNDWMRLCHALSYGALICALPACGGDNKVGLINDPPEVTFTSPSEMEVFLLTEPILLAAQVSDPQTSNELLDLSWGFSPEGSVEGEQEILEDEVTFLLPDGLEPGAYTVGLLAVDPVGARASDSVSFTVKENEPPSVTILDPVESKEFAFGHAVEVVLDIQDLDQRNIHELTLEWGGVAAGNVSAPAHPNSDGSAGFYLTGLPIGQYVLTVSVTDSLGAVDSDNCVFDVVDGDTDQDGYVSVEFDGDDCDDNDPAINPVADEVCDGSDNDCDSTVDEDDAVDAPNWYADLDMDAYGDPSAVTQACVQPAGYVDNDQDCNDGDASVFPGALEHCDGQDDDCDGRVDEEDAVDVTP